MRARDGDGEGEVGAEDIKPTGRCVIQMKFCGYSVLCA